MNVPDFYTSKNYMQKWDAKYILDFIKDKLPWSKGERILDVGCGPGDVTSTILYTSLPQDAIIVGCDISQDMIKFAKNNFENYKFRFEILDIENPNSWAKDNRGMFDKIFTFYTLHWVTNLRKATRNMNDLLRVNGHMVSMVLIYHPFMVISRRVKELSRWKDVLQILQAQDIFKSNSDEDKLIEYKKIIVDSDFEIISCSLMERIFHFPNMNELIGAFDVVNPLKCVLSKGENKMFLEDCIDYIESSGFVPRDKDGSYAVKYRYLLAHARKM